MAEGKKKFVWIIDDLGTLNTRLFNPNNSVIQQHFDLEFWDVRGIHKRWGKKHTSFRYEDADIYNVAYFTDKQQFGDEIKRLKNSGVDVAFLLSGKLMFWNRPLIRLMEKHGAPYFLRRNRIGFFHGGFGRRMSRINIASRWRRWLNDIYNLIIRNKLFLVGIKGPSKVFAGTRYDLDNINYPYSPKDVIYTHNKDYDNYLHSVDNENFAEKYFVYIDQYFPFHPEAVELNINAELFYSGIIDFLNRVSELTGINYLIAAHPISNKDILEKYLPADRITYGKTMAMMKNADFCVCFNSAVLLGAIITRTPILLISFNRVLPAYFSEMTQLIEELFKVGCTDVDTTLTKEHISEMLDNQEMNLKNVFEKYIKQPGSPEKLEFEIISEHVARYLS